MKLDSDSVTVEFWSAYPEEFKPLETPSLRT